jgi:hypothetical protein
VAQQPKQQGKQREESKLMAPGIADIKRRPVITSLRDCHVVDHVSLPHRSAKISGKRLAVQQDDRMVSVHLRERHYGDVSNTDEDQEDQTAREHEDEEGVPYASILPQTNYQPVVQQLSQSC